MQKDTEVLNDQAKEIIRLEGEIIKLKKLNDDRAYNDNQKRLDFMNYEKSKIAEITKSKDDRIAEIKESHTKDLLLKNQEMAEIREKLLSETETRKDYAKRGILAEEENEQLKKRVAELEFEESKSAKKIETFEKLKEASAETKPQELKIMDNKEYLAYLGGNVCVCGNEKKGSSKGCSECKKQADNIRVQSKCSFPQAWNVVWNKYGISMETGVE